MIWLVTIASSAAPVRADQTWLVSRAIPSTTPSGWTQPQAMSPDGRYVLLGSAATGWVSGVVDLNGSPDVYLWDRLTGSKTLVSHTAGDASTTANADSYPVAVSDDGQSVAFSSNASDLVPGQDDTNALMDVFFWDAASGEIFLASHAAAGVASAGDERAVATAMSADGRYLLFQSFADDLVAAAGDGNQVGDAFLWDRDTQAVTLVSHAAGAPGIAADLESQPAALSGDGRFVVFSSLATDLVAAGLDTNAALDAFLWDRTTGESTLVSHANGSTLAANGASSARAITGDGRFVVLNSGATDLLPTPSGPSGSQAIFLWDSQGDTMVMISHTPASSTSGLGAELAAITPDGQHIVFASETTALVAGGSDTNFSADAFLWSADTGAVTLLSHASGSATTTGNNVSNPVAVSDDGHYVLFESRASNLVPGGTDSNGEADAFLWDATSGGAGLVSHARGDATTTGNGGSSPHSMSADGNFVALSSYADDLVAALSDGNAADDSFLWQRESGDASLISSAAEAAATGGNGLAVPVAVSTDGQFAVFHSLSTNLVAAEVDTNGGLDVFHWSRGTETTTLVSHAAGAPTVAGNGPAEAVAMSPDGRFVAYFSFATNLVAGVADANSDADAFVWDSSSGASDLVSHAAGLPATAANGASTTVAMSSDGNYVLFSSAATDLVAGADGNGATDVFLWTRSTGAVTLVSHAAGAALTAGNGSAVAAGMSDDGRFVTFFAQATNLIVGGTDPNGALEDAFLWDRIGGAVTLISHLPGAATTTGNGKAIPVAVSADGQFVAFASRANNLLAGGHDSNPGFDLFHWDRQSGQVTLVSRAASAATTAGDDISVFEAMSADGRFVAYETAASDVIAGEVDANGPSSDAFLWDRTTGLSQLVSHAPGAAATTADGASRPTAISADGRYVALASSASDLVAGNVDDNGLDDLYLWDRLSDTLVLASHSLDDAARAAFGPSTARAMSADGNYILFGSSATDLVPAVAALAVQAYLWSATTIDVTPPFNPLLDPTLPAPSAWWNSDFAWVAWSGAEDEVGGSGLLGYSIVWDGLPTTAPDGSVDEPQAADPNSVYSPALADGTAHYFHLSACDAAGNCSAPIHAGPFWIDTAAPGAASALASSSHVVGLPTSDPSIDVQWSAALDQVGLSGVAGYALAFDGNAVWNCDVTLDVGAATLAVSSADLAQGSWFFHLCAADNAGNWGAVASIGPFVVDFAALPFVDGFESHDTSRWSFTVP